MTAVPETPRLVLYQQTHHVTVGGKEEYVSLLPLIGSGVTHVVISAFHLNEGGQVTLNDHEPGHERFESLWRETRQLQANDIKVMGMFGGAAQGTYARLQDEPELYTNVLKDTVTRFHLDGVDLDVEEHMTLRAIKGLIQRLKRDLGPDFLISLAPVYAAMLPSSRGFLSLTNRMLNATKLPAPDPLTAALCSSRRIRTKRNLSGFDYVDLETSPAGRLVDFYNIQLYNGWGDPCADGAYPLLVDMAGWQPERLVLGVLTHPDNGHNHRHVEELVPVITDLRARYGQRFGGVMGWEYFNAGMHQEQEGPWEWVQSIAAALGRF